MTQVFIVDGDATGLAASFNEIAGHEGHKVHYVPFGTPERFFEELRQVTPELVLIHHHWAGLTIVQLLERIRNTTGAVRVIVFTGQRVDIGELVACVRFGVCDYWLKGGAFDFIKKSRQIAYYCSSNTYTVTSLSQPTETVVGLLKEAEANARRLTELQVKNTALAQQLASERSEETRELRKRWPKIVEAVLALVLFVVEYLVVEGKTSTVAAWWLTALLVAFYLFLQGKLASAVFSVFGGTASFKDTPRTKH